jgi:hypothetical protein
MPSPPNLLYHYTSRLAWYFIQTGGITRGQVPISLDPFVALDYPNLTSDADPNNQWWGLGGEINKRAVQIPVEVPPGDDRLISWREFANLYRVSPEDYDRLNRLGNQGAPNWWIFRGTIPTKWIGPTNIIDGGNVSGMERRLLKVAPRYVSYQDMAARLGIIIKDNVTLIPNDFDADD